jgi:hypothetical protein
VKELYYYLDSTPTHSYMRMLYKYPQAEYPYQRLIDENQRRGRAGREFELVDSGVFEGNRYFDVFVEYAKAGPEDILCRIEVANRGPERAELDVLPTLWFRNTWSWDGQSKRPSIRAVRPSPAGGAAAATQHPQEGSFFLGAAGAPELLFTENDTNQERLHGVANGTHFVKDAFHACVVDGNARAVNPDQVGTKMAARYRLSVAPGASEVLRLRLRRGAPTDGTAVGRDFDQVFAARKEEADAYYGTVIPARLSDDATAVMRQALAGMLWSKQFYHYAVHDWLGGDPAQPAPPAARKQGRNADWGHVHNADVLSMPDKWEYPWYAAWDLAFHCIPLALVDPAFAKEQLLLLGERERHALLLRHTAGKGKLLPRATRHPCRRRGTGGLSRPAARGGVPGTGCRPRSRGRRFGLTRGSHPAARAPTGHVRSGRGGGGHVAGRRRLRLPRGGILEVLAQTTLGTLHALARGPVLRVGRLRVGPERAARLREAGLRVRELLHERLGRHDVFGFRERHLRSLFGLAHGGAS